MKGLLLGAFGFGVISGTILGFPFIVWGPEMYTLHSPPARGVSVLFVGDIMLDRHIREVGQEHGYDYILEPMADILRGADFVVGNLEGPITSASSTSVNSIVGSPENYSFTFAPETADFLARNNIRHVSLGNNHILNQGFQGLRETKEHLLRAGVSHFGAPDDEASISWIIKDDIRIGLIAYNEFWRSNATTTEELIRRVKQEGDFAVVMPHWGEEYALSPRVTDSLLAKRFVEAGADLVVGSHPHVIQSRERINDVRVYYSLGNFVFDQYWNSTVSCGLMLEFLFLKSGEIRGLSAFGAQLERSGQTVPSMCHSNFATSSLLL